MDLPQWAKYPYVSSHPLALALSDLEASLGHSPNTLDAYARGREDFFDLCVRSNIAPERATREHIARWVRELSTRSARRGSAEVLRMQAGLSSATIQQRLTAVRLFFDYLAEKGLRSDNPVGRGRYTPGKAFAGARDRGLVPRHRKLPWIPDENQWEALLRSIELEPVRNRAMFTLSYDAALRREELCLLEISDFDFAHKLVTIRAETTKSRQTRVVPFSAASSDILHAYFEHRRKLTLHRGPIFVSESPRNFGRPVSIWTWSKVAAHVAGVSGVTRFSTHTFRHLRLTDLARSGWDLHEIATFAGHRSLETTKHYIHLSGRDLARRLSEGMSEIHSWRIAWLAEHLF